MKKHRIILAVAIMAVLWSPLRAQEGLIPAFNLKPNMLTLERLARPGTPFDKAGRKFAILGDESGSFEAWAYPLKLFRNFQFSFLVGTSTRPVMGKHIVRHINVTPEATTLTYTYQSFTIKAIYITPIQTAGAIILLDVRSTVPMTIICGFLPVMQPMWPAGIGGQFAYWNNKQKAYIISESGGKNHAIVGSPAASGISYTPAHMLSDNPSEFKIEIADPKKVDGKYIPIILAGGPGKREQITKIYETLLSSPEKYYRDTADHYQNLLKNTLHVRTPNQKLNQAFDWAKISFDNLMVENPNLGLGMVAGLGASGTSGRPGFGWFFGGDAYINSLSLLSYGAHSTVRDLLAFTQKWQRKDGKMAHELSQAEGYVDWWNDYHYGYIHGDTTPYYIAAMYEYLRLSGDTQFIQESWTSLKKAFSWCVSTDVNKDGLMDNKKAGLGALEYGALTGIESDIYMSAVWVRAAYAMSQMAEAAGSKSLASQAEAIFQKAQKAFNEKFWDEESGFYAYAFNSNGQRVKEISPWNAVGLMWELGTPERSQRSLEKLCSSELSTDWGIRSISIKSKYFQPLNYNYGAVWPFLTNWVTTALYKHHLPLQGYCALMSTVMHTFDNSLGNLTEVFSGTHYIWPQEAVPHQGFSTSGVVLPFVKGLLGLEGDAQKKSIFFAPHFPADWSNVTIQNCMVGSTGFSFNYQRTKDKISVRITPENAEGFRLVFAPALTLGSKVNAIKVNGSTVDCESMTSGSIFQPQISVDIQDNPVLIEIAFSPTLEILPFITDTRVGDRNNGLKIISVHRDGLDVTVNVEGLSGHRYRLGALNTDLIKSIKGAEIRGSRLIINIPDGDQEEFLPHAVQIHLQNTDEK